MTEMGEAPTAAALGSAVLYCENCGRETPHRILRLGRSAGGRASRAVAGVARCRECRWTHPFLSAPRAHVTVEAVVSLGSNSVRREVDLPPSERLRVGDRLPGVAPPATVRRLDLHDGGTPTEADAREVHTAWAVQEGPHLLRIAVLQGSRSTTERLAAVQGLQLGIGQELRLPAGPVTIVALRARGHTWRRPGDGFPAEEVDVVYARRTVRPPAGRSGWSRARPTPRSRASSTSRAERSRSSPGLRRNRTVPRA